jgi:mannose-6-phosphate isomerase-like protein (cupin superfamily)
MHYIVKEAKGDAGKWVGSVQLKVLGRMEEKVQGEGRCKKHFRVITGHGKMKRGDSDNEKINS